MKYYVLGKENNQMLLNYRDGYYEILKSYIINLQDSELKDKLFLLKEDKEFVLYTDNSSRIEYLYYFSKDGFKLFGHENIISGFIEDIDYYNLNKEFNNNKEEKIQGTEIYLTINDKNPFNGVEDHPDNKKSGVKIGFGDKDYSYWKDVYKEVFSSLKSIDKGIYDELNFIINKIVPLGTSDYIHNSASYKEAIGHLYMGLTIGDKATKEDSVIQCLEAIIHESSHNKLNLIGKFDSILLNNFELKYYSPYRPDARHIWGIFLGIHAFVPTIYTLLRYYKENNLYNNKLLEKLVIYNTKNALSLKVLKKYAKFTKIGSEILSEVIYVMKLTNDLFKELLVSSELINISKEKVKSHFEDVKNNYDYLKY